VREDRRVSESPDAQEIAAALQALAAALQDPDPTAWVAHYTEDAVFDGGGESAVVGRAALLDLAQSMQPMRSVTITPLRIEAHGDLAATWFSGSWVSGSDDAAIEPTQVRGLLVMRRESDGAWRVVFERIG
jgi:ketosteroid isomerase-like protein